MYWIYCNQDQSPIRLYSLPSSTTVYLVGILSTVTLSRAPNWDQHACFGVYSPISRVVGDENSVTKVRQHILQKSKSLGALVDP